MSQIKGTASLSGDCSLVDHGCQTNLHFLCVKWFGHSTPWILCPLSSVYRSREENRTALTDRNDSTGLETLCVTGLPTLYMGTRLGVQNSPRISADFSPSNIRVSQDLAAKSSVD